MSSRLSKLTLWAAFCFGNFIGAGRGDRVKFPTRQHPHSFLEECRTYIRCCQAPLRELPAFAKELKVSLGAIINPDSGNVSEVEIGRLKENICKIEQKMQIHKNLLLQWREVVAGCKESFDWSLAQAAPAERWQKEEALYKQLSKEIVCLESIVGDYAQVLDEHLLAVYDKYCEVLQAECRYEQETGRPLCCRWLPSLDFGKLPRK